ncbi:MAG: hypothetical protein ABIP71_15190 [Verrucomicrobiota bacterium]
MHLAGANQPLVENREPMEENAQPIANAWQPFTPKGVAAFAQSPPSRWITLQLIVAFIAASVVIWFLNANYSPAILEAAQHSPDRAAIEGGQLTNLSSGILTQKKFLSVIVDLEATRQSGQTSDLQLELRQKYFQICSILGCVMFNYPHETILLGRAVSEPWWGARQPVILTICGALTIAALLLTWTLLSLVYAPMAKLIAYFANRELSWRGSWRLASASQMMAALLMTFAILLYGLQAFDLIRFLFFFAAHFFVSWVYVFAAPHFLPRVSVGGSTANNPFN